MDQKKLEALQAKRLKLQEASRLKSLRAEVATEIAHLEILNHTYSIFYKGENFNWIQSNIKLRKRDGYMGIHEYFQIDVNDPNALNVFSIAEVNIDSEKFGELFSSIISKASSFVICYQSTLVELEISAKAFFEKPSVFLSSPETWVLNTDKKWIIEYIWVQGVIRVIQLQESIPTLNTIIHVDYNE